MRLVLLIAMLLLPALAFADEGVLLQIVGYALVATGNAWGYALIVGGAVYSADKAKRRLAQNQEDARNARNAAMQDRMATVISEEAPHTYVYGRARVGSAIVAMFTSGVRDEYKHLVCIHAAHECDAIEEIFVAGKSLGVLDGNGDVTAGDYLVERTTSVSKEAHTGAAFTLAQVPVPGTLRVTYIDGEFTLVEPILTLVGADVTVATSRSYKCHYEYQDNESRCRVQVHLGTPTDTADATLLAEVPTKWDANAVLRDFCYTVVRLHLDQPEFQGGVPAVEVVMRGKKIYDPRDASTVWKQNNALVVLDYLTSPMCQVATADIPSGYLIAAANVCDETNSHGLPRYTCNGVVFATQAQPKVLELLAQSMAGSITSTTWEIIAGKYIAPVLALEQEDIIGNFALTPGISDASVFNGVKGQFFSVENSYVKTDHAPYQDAVYRAADGRDLYENIDRPFTDTLQAVHDLARIETEDARNGYSFSADFSMKAWGVKVGERITQNSAVFGWSAKVYRVLDRSFSAMKGVTLLLKEDAASIWDEAPAVTVDATPNTNLPNPFEVGIPGNVQMVEALYQTTGSAGVKAKATVSWDEPLGQPVDYELEYKLYTSGDWLEIPNIKANYYEFPDIAPGKYDFRVKARNVLNAISPYTDIKTFIVYGLTAVPADVSGLSAHSFAGMCMAEWTLSTDLDVRIGGKVQIRHTLETAAPVWEGGTIIREPDGYATSAMLPLIAGTYMAKFVDSSGQFSTNAAMFEVTESLITGYTTIVSDATTAQHSVFSGTKTQCEVSGSNLILSDTYYDATYDYAANIDAGSVAARRWFSHIVANCYLASDLISARGLVSTWTSVSSTSEINDCNAYQEIRVSDDAATWSAWTRFTVADFTCRYAQVRLRMTRGDLANNIEIVELSTSAKV